MPRLREGRDAQGELDLRDPSPASRRRSWLDFVKIAVLTLVLLDVTTSLFLIHGGKLLGRVLLPWKREAGEVRAWVDEQHAELAKPIDDRGAGMFDAELGWTNRAGYTTAGGATKFNSIAARGSREYAAEPPPGVVRVACFGESFTYGAQGSDSDTFEFYMEQSCAEVEALNFGVNGFGSDQALLRFRREGRGLGAHVIVLGLMLENIGRNVNRHKDRWQRQGSSPGAKPRFVLKNGELELVPLPFRTQQEELASVMDGTIDSLLAEHEYWREPSLPRWLWRSAFVRIGATWFDDRRRELTSQWTDRDGEPYQVLRAVITTFHREALQSGARHFCALLLPGEMHLRAFQRDGVSYWRGMLDDLAARGVETLDMCTLLARQYPQSLDAHGRSSLYAEKHLSGEGNALVARTIMEWLEQRYPALKQ